MDRPSALIGDSPNVLSVNESAKQGRTSSLLGIAHAMTSMNGPMITRWVGWNA